MRCLAYPSCKVYDFIRLLAIEGNKRNGCTHHELSASVTEVRFGFGELSVIVALLQFVEPTADGSACAR